MKFSVQLDITVPKALLVQSDVHLVIIALLVLKTIDSTHVRMVNTVKLLV